MAGILTCELTRAGIISTARTQIGVEFYHQGRTPRTEDHEGRLDCIGLTVFALESNGWTPLNPDSCLRLDYPRVPDGHELGRALHDEYDEITLDEAQPADLLSMKWKGDRYERHIAMISERNPVLELIRPNLGLSVIHTHPNLKVCEHGLRPEWLPRIVGVYRLKSFSPTQ